jgi:hypothetical protein
VITSVLTKTIIYQISLCLWVKLKQIIRTYLDREKSQQLAIENSIWCVPEG